jgi:hypothetical protein
MLNELPYDDRRSHGDKKFDISYFVDPMIHVGFLLIWKL